MKKLSALVCVTLAAWVSVAATGPVFGQVEDSLGGGGGGRGGAVFGGNTSAFGYVGSDSNAPSPPWFSSPGIREQLALDDDRAKILTNSYNDNRNRYRQEVSSLDNNLTSEERERRSREIHDRYSNEFDKNRSQVLKDADILRRYQQLHLQYQGYGAFYDPRVQRQLNLTAEQHQILHRYHVEALKDMEDFRNRYGTDPEETARKFADWRVLARDRIYSTFTPQQKQIWKEIIGDPYDFRAADFFSGRSNPPRANP